MNQEIAHKILDIQDQIQTGERYRQLMEDYEYTGKRFSDLLPTLTQRQQDIILDHFGVFISLHLKMLELALE